MKIVWMDYYEKPQELIQTPNFRIVNDCIEAMDGLYACYDGQNRYPLDFEMLVHIDYSVARRGSVG